MSVGSLGALKTQVMGLNIGPALKRGLQLHPYKCHANYAIQLKALFPQIDKSGISDVDIQRAVLQSDAIIDDNGSIGSSVWGAKRANATLEVLADLKDDELARPILRKEDPLGILSLAYSIQEVMDEIVDSALSYHNEGVIQRIKNITFWRLAEMSDLEGTHALLAQEGALEPGNIERALGNYNIRRISEYRTGTFPDGLDKATTLDQERIFIQTAGMLFIPQTPSAYVFSARNEEFFTALNMVGNLRTMPNVVALLRRAPADTFYELTCGLTKCLSICRNGVTFSWQITPIKEMISEAIGMGQ